MRHTQTPGFKRRYRFCKRNQRESEAVACLQLNPKSQVEQCDFGDVLIVDLSVDNVDVLTPTIKMANWGKKLLENSCEMGMVVIVAAREAKEVLIKIGAKGAKAVVEIPKIGPRQDGGPAFQVPEMCYICEKSFKILHPALLKRFTEQNVIKKVYWNQMNPPEPTHGNVYIVTYTLLID